jgi:hypothetical protein
LFHLDTFTRLRLQRRVEHLHALGPGVTAKFWAEVGPRIGGMPAARQRFSNAIINSLRLVHPEVFANTEAVP